MKTQLYRAFTFLLVGTLLTENAFSFSLPKPQTRQNTVRASEFQTTAMSLFPSSWTRRGAFRSQNTPFLPRLWNVLGNQRGIVRIIFRTTPPLDEPKLNPAQILSNVLGGLTLINIPPIPSATYRARKANAEVAAEPLKPEEKLHYLNHWRDRIHDRLGGAEDDSWVEAVTSILRPHLNEKKLTAGFAIATAASDIVYALRHRPRTLRRVLRTYKLSEDFADLIRWYTGIPRATLPVSIEAWLYQPETWPHHRKPSVEGDNQNIQVIHLPGGNTTHSIRRHSTPLQPALLHAA